MREDTSIVELTLPQRASITEVDTFLTTLVDAPPDAPLLVPTSLRLRQLGGTPASIQAIISWARRCPEGELRTHVQDGEPPDETNKRMERLLTADHGLVAAGLAARVKTRSGGRELDVENQLRRRLNSMGTVPNAKRGAKALLMCLDNTVFASPRTLYQPRSSFEEPELRDHEGFLALSRELGSAITRGPGTAGAPSPLDNPDFSALLLELLRNTHDWARSRPDGRRYEPSARGVRIELHNLDPDQTDALTEGAPSFARFLRHSALRPFEGRTRLVELAIFDSGPGLAARRLAEQGEPCPTPGLEYMAVRDCLARHFSAAHDPARGSGLHRVLMKLTLMHGFMILRTGGVHLYRDFVQQPYEHQDDHAEPFLTDWSGQEEIQAAPSVSGTLFTLLFPLPYVTQEQLL